jgi:hypothetical protein
MVDPSANLIMTPVMQYGFAGMSAVLIVIIVWLISKLLGLLKENSKVIAENTSTIANLGQRMVEDRDTLHEVRDLVRDLRKK